MEEEFIDVHRTREGYERTIELLKADRRYSARNKELVLSFLRDAALGKTVLGRAKKKIGPARLANYVKHLRHLVYFMKRDLDSASQSDIEAFIEALEGGKIRSMPIPRDGRVVVSGGRPLSPQYRVDIKVSIKKFYKWLWGNNKSYPPIVEWIDTFVEPKELPAITEANVEKMIDFASSLKQRAVIQVLFDGGFRLGELLNIRLRHVRFASLDPADSSKQCFVLRAPFSKTIPRTVPLPMRATTKWLKLWLQAHPARPVISGNGTLEAVDLHEPLFRFSESSLRLQIRRIAQHALGRPICPQMLRHASATYWSNRLSYFRQCRRFGWVMTSKMPQRYIDREGVDELGAAFQYFQEEKARPSETDGRVVNDTMALQAYGEREEGDGPPSEHGGIRSHAKSNGAPPTGASQAA